VRKRLGKVERPPEKLAPKALFCLNNPLTLILRREIVEFAARERLPAIYRDGNAGGFCGRRA
jgi:hypothetical protein